MAEYLEREELLRELRLWHMHRSDEMPDYFHYTGIKAWIEALPAEDVQPVKHGKWIQDEHTYSGCWTYNYVCSACGEIGGSWLRNIRRDQMFPYCPFCGAKMDGEE